MVDREQGMVNLNQKKQLKLQISLLHSTSV
jgi:hypothetical protein